MFDSLQPLDCSPPGSSAMGILQTRILKLVTMPSWRVSSQSRTEPWSPALQADSLPCEPPGKPYHLVQLSSVTHRAQLLVTPWTAAHQASLSITSSRSLLKLMSIESVMPSNHLILCCPLLLPPSIFPSIRVFSNESVIHIRWPKYWSFSFSISPSPEAINTFSHTEF